MKKMLSLLLALAMCASLAACGGGEDEESGGPTDAQLQALTDAYNQVATLYNDVATTAEANGWLTDEQTASDIQTIGDTLEPVGQALTGDLSALDGADFDDLPNALLEYLPALQELAEKVAAPLDGVVTDEALKPLAQAYNELAPVFNDAYEAAQANGWLADEQTAAEFEALTGTLSYIGSGLTDDPSKLEGADLDGLVEQLQQLAPALNELAQRVSVPYAG